MGGIGGNHDGDVVCVLGERKMIMLLIHSRCYYKHVKSMGNIVILEIRPGL
jgi:hypothetical protein